MSQTKGDTKNKSNEIQVYQSNRLVEAFWDNDLSATEHKIIRYAAAKMKNHQADFPVISFTVSEFLSAGGIKSNNYHAKIEKIADELSKKRVKIKTLDNKQMRWLPWFSDIYYNNGIIQIEFNEKLKPLLLMLNGQFTRYPYGYIGDMRSSYTIRLFELLKQYAPIGKRRIKIDTLKRMLGIEGKYKKYSHFKSRVLNQAKKELDRKEKLTFEFEEIKQGRRVIELIFYIEMEKQLSFDDIEDTNEEVIFLKEAKLLLEGYGYQIPDHKVKKWKKYGIEMLNGVLKEINDRKTKMDSPFAYIDKVLESKYEDKMKIQENLTGDETDKKYITEFMMKKISYYERSTPDWFVKRDFERQWKGELNQEKIDALWEKNKDYILSKVYF